MAELLDHIVALSPAKRALLERLMARQGIALAKEMILPRAEQRPHYPATHSQRRLWFLRQIDGPDPVYNLPLAVQITGALDADVLEAALHECIRMHESLRTVFAGVQGVPVQIIRSDIPFTLRRQDLRGVPAGERRAFMQAAGERFIAEPFDLESGPLIRGMVIRLEETTWVLILCVHHIVADGWSMGILLEDAVAHYQSLRDGGTTGATASRLQYADYALWLEGRAEDPVTVASRTYWRDHLQGLPPALDWGTGRPRPSIMHSRGTAGTFLVPPAMQEGLRVLARESGTTMFMVLLAAFHACLARLTGTGDIPIGTPVANRSRPELERVIGFFVNTIVMRCGVPGRASFREFLGRVRETALEAFAHQEHPFEALVEDLSPDRSLSHAPVYQVMFALQNIPPRVFALPAFRVQEIHLVRGTSMCDLTLSMAETGDGLNGSIECSLDLFDRAGPERFRDRFLRLLTGILADPGRKVDRLPVMGDHEWQRVVGTFARREVPLPPVRTIQQAFEDRERESPDAGAVTDGQVTLSYRELHAQASRIAAQLIREGLEPGACAGVCLDRSIDQVAAMVGILLAGGAYVPLDPSLPSIRLGSIIAQAEITHCVLAAQHGALIAGACGDRRSMVLLSVQPWDALSPAECLPPRPRGPHDLAYVLFTSGSTGVPKGVCCEHAGVMNLLDDLQRIVPVGPGDRCAWFASAGFDVSVYEIFAPLCSGATLLIVPAAIRADAPAYFRWLRDQRATSAYIPPGMVAELAAWLDGQDAIPTLRRLLVGVEPIPEKTLTEIAGRIPGLTIVNGYGPTETTVCCTLYPVPGDVRGEENTPIGRPVQNDRIYLVDANLEPVPPGTAGELLAGGEGLARGYAGRPDLTAALFIPDHLSGIPGARLYRTGDLARFRDDGMLMFIGRRDLQVKIRGHRVELGEIRNTVQQHPRVGRAAVTVWEPARADGSPAAAGRAIVAYVTGTDGPPPPADELRAFVAGRLPDYMVPALFLGVDAIPENASGKIDTAALPSPAEALAALREETYEQPLPGLETMVASVWADVLGVERCGAADNFFELGGHSLKATQMAARLRGHLAVEIPVRLVFEAPTVRGFAARIAAMQPDDAVAAEPPLVSVPRTGDLPLSFAQERLWFLEHLEPGGGAYVLPIQVRFEGELRTDLLVQALSMIVRRHEILRTVFPEQDGRAVQRILPPAPLTVREEDLSACAVDDRDAALRSLMREEIGRPFPLETGPLLRFTMCRTDRSTWTVLAVMHHIIADGWSAGVLVRELATLYREALAGMTGDPVPLPMQYADFAVWQRNWLQGERLAAHLAWWKDTLGGAMPLDLPLDHPRPAVLGSRGGRCGLAVSERTSAAVRDCAQREGASPFMVLMAAFQVLLHRYSGQVDICTGTPIANRTRHELEPLIGFFVNTLVIRTDFSDDPTFTATVRRVRTAALDAYAHQDVPFEKVVDAVHPARDTSRTPLFQAMFVLQNAPSGPLQLPGVTVTTEDPETGASPFELTLVLEEIGGVYRGGLEFNTDLFTEEHAATMCGEFVAVLDSLLNDPTHPVSAALLEPLRSAGDHADPWNVAPSPDRPPHMAPTLIAQRCRAASGAAAVDGDDGILCYDALEQRVSVLAAHLQATGVGHGATVGVCVDRSSGLVVAMLAILRTGAAFVPLDPFHPPERNASVTGQAGVRTIITQRTHESVLRPLGCRLLCLDDVDPDGPPLPGDGFRVADDPDAPAYVIFTSGSTGQPKGVVVPHGALINHNLAVIDAYGLTAADRVLQFASVTFDASLEEILPTLEAGATLVMRRDAHMLAPADFLAMVGEARITVLEFPTTYWSILVTEMDRAHLHFPASVRLVAIGGDRLTPEALAAWRGIGTENVVLVNTYGPTEGTIIATLTRVDRDEMSPCITIGHALPNVLVHVLDSALHPVPPGVVGEIHIGGRAPAQGYAGRPDLTADSFIPDPLTAVPGSRMYRTRDRGRRRPDGSIEFLGRVDDQVKVRGFRVEPREIEVRLRQHPAVRHAAVLAHDEGVRGRSLAAYVVTDPSGTTGAGDLRSWLAQRLPDFMVPSRVVVVERLPLSASGKVDRAALAAMPVETVTEERRHEEARTATEAALVRIWQEVLGVERVGVTENFFELGGDSILSIQVVSRAREAGVYLSVRQIFQYPTIRELAGAQGEERVAPAEEGVLEGAVPLTPIQEWFFGEGFAEANHWNQSVVVEAGVALGHEEVEAMVEAVVRHHDVLRMRYRRTATGWEQWMAGMGDALPVVYEDLRVVGEAGLEACLGRWQRSLDLEGGPVLRVVVVELPGRQVVGVMVHHLVIDGVSWRILLEDMETACRQVRSGQPVRLPPKTASFRQWATALRARAASGEADSQLGYWTQMLGTRAPGLPVDHDGGSNLERDAATYTVTLESGDAQKILHAGTAVHAGDIDALFLAALTRTIGAWCGTDEALFETEWHGRALEPGDPDTTRTVGWFTSVCPVRLSLRNTHRATDMLAAIRRQMAELRAHRASYPLLRWLSPDPAVRTQLAGLPQPAVSFNYLGRFDAGQADGGGWRVAPVRDALVRSPDAHRTTLIDVTGGASGSRLTFDWHYSTAIHAPETIARLAGTFVEHLRTFAAAADADVPGSNAPADIHRGPLDRRTLDRIAGRIGRTGTKARP